MDVVQESLLQDIEKKTQEIAREHVQYLPLVLVWGNGSFGPTSKGHDSAPNEGLRRGLVRYVPIVLCSEYNDNIKATVIAHTEAEAAPS